MTPLPPKDKPTDDPANALRVAFRRCGGLPRLIRSDPSGRQIIKIILAELEGRSPITHNSAQDAGGERNSASDMLGRRYCEAICWLRLLATRFDAEWPETANAARHHADFLENQLDYVVGVRDALYRAGLIYTSQGIGCAAGLTKIGDAQ